MSLPRDIAAAVDLLLDELARRVAARLSPASDECDQTDSPAGPRHHIQLVRSGKVRGYRRGRRWVACRTDVLAHLASPSGPAGSEDGATRSIAGLAEELGLTPAPPTRHKK